MSYIDAVRAWHDFFMVTGEASGTLVGLLFVAMSVASGYFDETRYIAARVFFSPSVVLFACVLGASLIAIIPTSHWQVIGLLLGGEGAFGLGYAGIVWRNMIREGYTARLDLEDTLYYVALPAVGHLVVIAAAILFLRQSDTGCDVLAVAVGLLIVIGMRNAWDMTVWTATHMPPPSLTSSKARSSATAPSTAPVAPPPAPPSSDPRPAGSAETG